MTKIRIEMPGALLIDVYLVLRTVLLSNTKDMPEDVEEFSEIIRDFFDLDAPEFAGRLLDVYIRKIEE